MSNLNLFVAGGIHQGSERFSDISRGRQCSFMSFSALLYAHTVPIEQWTASDVDQILAQGDRLYLDAFESKSIPDTETLSLDYLPRALDANTMQIYTRQTNDSLIWAESKANNLSPWADVESLIRVTNPDLPVVIQNSQHNIMVNRLQRVLSRENNQCFRQTRKSQLVLYFTFSFNECFFKQ